MKYPTTQAERQPAEAVAAPTNGDGHKAAANATGNGTSASASGPVTTPARALEIVPLTTEHAGQWDEFVTHAPTGLPQHLSGWQRVLANTYGYETHFVMAVETVAGDNTRAATSHIRGVLPLFWIATPLVGRTLTTTPGGLCAADADAAASLVAYAQTHARQEGAKSLVLQDSRAAHPGLSAVTLHEAHLLDLGAGHDALWQGLDRNIRRQVRMAERNEVVVEIDRTGARLDDFYTVMSRFTHLAGTPIFPQRFLEEVVAAFPQGIHLAMAYHAGEPVGGYFQLARGDTLVGTWGATLPAALSLRTVYLAYWSIMADAVAQGFTTLDMGRSPADSNASKFKAQWGGTTVPVYQQTWQPDGSTRTATVTTQAQEDSRFQLVRRLWPRLPYAVATWLGPQVRRYIPFG
ncbi:MAG: GNAT family N-acetyltransferase [Litorilinea sp.]